jgi:hypothetical protein
MDAFPIAAPAQRARNDTIRWSEFKGFTQMSFRFSVPNSAQRRGLPGRGDPLAADRGASNALLMPLYDLVSNWAYMVSVTLAWNLKSWFAMMMHRKADRRDYIRMEFRRFLHGIILIPAMISRPARMITVRLIGYHPSLDRLFSAWHSIERTRFD